MLQDLEQFLCLDEESQADSCEETMEHLFQCLDADSSSSSSGSNKDKKEEKPKDTNCRHIASVIFAFRHFDDIKGQLTYKHVRHFVNGITRTRKTRQKGKTKKTRKTRKTRKPRKRRKIRRARRRQQSKSKPRKKPKIRNNDHRMQKRPMSDHDKSISIMCMHACIFYLIVTQAISAASAKIKAGSEQSKNIYTLHESQHTHSCNSIYTRSSLGLRTYVRLCNGM